jgi:Periplasmic binding protein-like domain/Bacterial regulatory proteins, gntR family
MVTVRRRKTRRRLAYEDIENRLRAQLGRRWKAGARLPSIRALALELQAGYINTHRAVRNLVDSRLLVSQPRVGVFVAKTVVLTPHAVVHSDTRPSTMGRPLAGVRIDLLRHTDEQGFGSLITQAFTRRVEAWGCIVNQTVVDASVRSLDLRSRDTDAFALVLPVTERVAFGAHAPAVVIATSLDQMPDLSGTIDIVAPDQLWGARLAGAHFRKHAVSPVCYLGSTGNNDRLSPSPHREHLNPTSRSRLEGFEMGLGDTVADRHLLLAQSFDQLCGAKAITRYLAMPDRPRAVFAASDDLAIGFVQGAAAHGLEPGSDFDIIGFDGQPLGRRLPGGSLTTVDLPQQELGEQAGDLLIDRLGFPARNSRRLMLGCSLHIGGTVAADRQPAVTPSRPVSRR